MMNRPNGGDPDGPYPSVRGALMLTLMAIIAAGFTGIAFIDFGLLAAVGIGQAIGVGAVATMGAQRVAEPQAARLGLRALDLEAIPLILCLLPAVLLASELDNFATDWSTSSSTESEESISSGFDAPGDFPVADGGADAAQSGASGSAESAGSGSPGEATDSSFRAERDGGDPGTPVAELGGSSDEFGEVPATEGSGSDDEAPLRLIDPDDPASVLQAYVVIVGITPIVEEFLFRGVIQQGLLQRLGLLRGLSVVALLWTLLRPAPIAGFVRFAAAAAASFALGWALGLVRVATGSILGPILLASGWAAIGLTATIFENKYPLPGMNVEGTHLPFMVTLGSLAIVGWAGWTMFQEAESRFASDAQAATPATTEPDPDPDDEA